MSPMSWVVNEESIDGTCSVIYQLNELPAYLAKDSSSRNNNGTFKCDQGTTYELTKTKDVNSCSKRATFMNYKPGFFSCPAGNCDGQWSRSSITRYVACGTSGPQNLEIKAIINEGEFNLDLLGFKTEKVLSGTKQVLELLSKKKTGTPFPQPSQPKTFDNLRYVYSSWEMPHSQSVEHGLEKGVLSGLNLEKPAPFRSLPQHTLTAPQWRNGSHDGTAQLIPQIEKYVTELVIVDLEKAENIAQKQVTMKVLTIARGLTVLSEDQIKQVYNKLKGNFNSSPEQLTTFKNVMFDCMIMSGSSSAMKVLKPLIESGELSDSQTAAVFMFLPTYIVTPTQELLSQIFELVKSSRVNKSNLVYSHALMSFSTLIQKACIAENRKTSYPTFVYGEFCNQDSQIVVQQWIPYLQSELQKHSSAGNVERMNVALVSLGVLGHKNIIPVVLPFVESGSEQYQKEGPLSRFLAVSSLGVVGQMHPETVAPLALSIFGNLGESTEVRVAAFNVLLKLDPPTVILQKIASITWYETNMEVLKVVNTALLSLSREYNMAIVNTKIGHLQKRCSLIYPLIKKIEGAFPTSGSVFTSDYLNELGVGFVGLTSWISSPSSTLPQNIYAKLVYFLDRYQYSPMAVNVRTSGMDTVVRTLSEIIRHPSESKESIQENLKQQLSGEWRKTVEKLNIQSRGGSGFSASLFMQLFEDNALFYNFDTVSEQFIREKMTPYMKNPSLLKSKVGGETPINFQRMLDFGPSEYLVPSDMGMPFVIEAHMPVVISFKGTANIETGATIPAVNMKVKTIFAAQYTGWAGTICPFTDETVLIGIDEHSVLNIPGEVNIELKPQEQKLKVNIKPLTANQPIDIFHFHVRPFGVTQKFWDLTPFTISKGMQLINSATPTTKITRDVGEYIGLNLNAIITTQSPFTTKSGLVDKLRLYKYNPLNFIRFFWASSALSEVNKPSIRMHEFELRFDPSHEGINDIEMLFQLGTASKVHGEPAKYHAVKVDEEKKSSSSLPYAIESKPMSEVSSGIHAERSEKIEKMFQKLSLDSGSGFSLMYSLTLKGPRPRTWTYSLSAAAGSQGIQQKWDIQAESQKSSKKVCFSGTATIPTVPVWKLEEIRNSNAQFTVQSTFGFGSTCQESQIKLSTVSQVSDEQKEFSRTSPEAKEFRQRKSEGKHSELSELAEKVRSQASTTDKVQLKVQFVSVPKDVLYYSESVVTFFKAYWWKYMTESHGAAKFDGNSQVINIGFSLKPANKAVAVTMSRPDEKVVWTNIPLPYSFCWIMGWPSSAATTQAEGGHRPHHHEQQQQQTGLTSSVGGSIQSRIRSVLPGGPLPGSTCIVEGSTLETVTKKSIKLALDDCFYLLAADCSEKKSWGLLMRPVGPSKGKDLKLFYGKTTLLLNPTVQSATGPSPVEVTVDGSKVTIAKGASYIVKDDKKTQVMKITK